MILVHVAMEQVSMWRRVNRPAARTDMFRIECASIRVQHQVSVRSINMRESVKKEATCGSPFLLPEVFDDSVQFRADSQDFVQPLLPLALDLLLAAETTPPYTGQPHAHGRHTLFTCPEKTFAAPAQQFCELLSKLRLTAVREPRRL